MEQSPSLEAESHSASQEISHLLWFITVFTKARHLYLLHSFHTVSLR